MKKLNIIAVYGNYRARFSNSYKDKNERGLPRKRRRRPRTGELVVTPPRGHDGDGGKRIEELAEEEAARVAWSKRGRLLRLPIINKLHK